MRLTNRQLKQIIKEEIQKVLNEQGGGRVKCKTGCKAKCTLVIRKKTDPGEGEEINPNYDMRCREQERGNPETSVCFKECFDPCFDQCDAERARKSAEEAAQGKRKRKQQKQEYEKERAKRRKKAPAPKIVERRDDHCLSNRFCRTEFTKKYICKKCYCNTDDRELVKVKDKRGEYRILKYGICASKTSRTFKFKED